MRNSPQKQTTWTVPQPTAITPSNANATFQPLCESELEAVVGGNGVLYDVEEYNPCPGLTGADLEGCEAAMAASQSASG